MKFKHILFNEKLFNLYIFGLRELWGLKRTKVPKKIGFLVFRF